MQAAYFALAFAMFVQFLGVVWAAAKMHSAVANLEKTTTKLGTTLDAIVEKVHKHSEQIAVLETKVG